MKVLLINPRYFEETYRYKVNKLCPPLGMAIIASALLDAKHDVKIIDLEAMKANINSRIAAIKHFNPDIIGVFGTSPINKYIDECLYVLRDTCPSSTIIAGGPHATLFPKDLLGSESDENFDYIFRGESETSIVEFVCQIERYNKVVDPVKIRGIGYKTKEGYFIHSDVPHTENLDSVPMPAYKLLPIASYFESGSSEKIMTMITSRGCPNRCIYCSAPILYGHKFRSRSPESVVREMKYLREEFRIDHIVFYDANFNHDKDRVKEICRKIIADPVGMTWRARVRADKIDEEMVILMKESGCTELSVGVETGSQKLLNVLKKNLTKNEIRNAFQLIKEHGLWCSGYFMFGIPNETSIDAEETIDFAIELDPDWALFSSATPFPGTEFHRIARDNIIDINLNNYRFNFDKPIVSYDCFTSEQIEHYINLAYDRFYLRKNWIINRIKKAEDNKQIENIIDSYMYYSRKKQHRNALSN